MSNALPEKRKGIELCNRTACQTDHNVIMYNATMQAWYCVRCARLINDSANQSGLGDLCVIDEKRKLLEIQRRKAKYAM